MPANLALTSSHYMHRQMNMEKNMGFMQQSCINAIFIQRGTYWYIHSSFVPIPPTRLRQVMIKDRFWYYFSIIKCWNVTRLVAYHEINRLECTLCPRLCIYVSPFHSVLCQDAGSREYAHPILWIYGDYSGGLLVMSDEVMIQGSFPAHPDIICQVYMVGWCNSLK